MTKHLSIGTRGSPLALTQARMVADALMRAHGWEEGAVAIVPIRTSGDKIQHRPLAEIGGKALWTKELDLALMERRIDIAVHSMKDVETFRPSEICIAAILPREDVRDRLIGAPSIQSLPRAACVGTSSPRRAAQLLHARPDLRIAAIRGNVATRLERLEKGEFDATLLAAAGLRRLGHDNVGSVIEVEEMLPAPAQGAVGVEALRHNIRIHELLAPISERGAAHCVSSERALLAELGGTCRSPVGALAVLDGETLILRAEILSPDGKERIAEHHSGPLQDSGIASVLADRLLSRASPALCTLFKSC